MGADKEKSEKFRKDFNKTFAGAPDDVRQKPAPSKAREVLEEKKPEAVNARGKLVDEEPVDKKKSADDAAARLKKMEEDNEEKLRRLRE